MAGVAKFYLRVLFLFMGLTLFAGAAFSLPPAATEMKPEPPKKSRQVLLLAVDGLQAGDLSQGRTPIINGLGMAGVRADRVASMPPDTAAARLYTVLSGCDPADHGYTGQAAPKIKSIISGLEARGMKTAVVDGTGSLEKACEEAKIKNFGPFAGDRGVASVVQEIMRDQKPFFTVAVLPGPAHAAGTVGPGAGNYQEALTRADTEIGKILKQLHSDGTYESTLLVVTGTTGKPPLVIKGSEFTAGSKMPPVCSKDIAPTLAYLYGVEMQRTSGLVIWNALRPSDERPEIFTLAQRVRDLSTAYADAVDAAARLENEKFIVQEEKSRLARDKQAVEGEIQAREDEIGRLSAIITAMKAAGAVALVLFAAALIIEYRILKKRYLFFT